MTEKDGGSPLAGALLVYALEADQHPALFLVVQHLHDGPILAGADGGTVEEFFEFERHDGKLREKKMGVKHHLWVDTRTITHTTRAWTFT